MATTARHRVEAVTAGWFTPPRLLALFCLMSLLVYVDRGVISSAAVSGSPRGGDAGDPGSGLQGEFGVGYALFGLLQAAFMLGLLLGAPAFSAAAKTWNPFKLIGLGLAGWTLAVAGCATATTYAAFFFCRVFVGLGEASFCALAAPFIDDFAPPGRKTLWLAAFYLCIPLGVAGGVMFGGAVAGAPEGQSLGWRWAFGLEAVAMTPVALFCLASEPIPMRGVDDRARVRIGPARSGARDEEAGASPETAGLLEGDGGDGSGATAGAEDGASSSTSFAGASASARGSAPPKRKLASSSSGEDFASLRRNRAFLTALAGYVAYTGTIGVYAAWGPKAGYGVYSEELGSPSRSDVVLGGITVLAGVAGTLMGGVAADAAGADARAAVAVCAVCAAVAFAFLELAFRAAAFATFACLFAIGQTFAFGVQAPVNAVVLRSVRARERPLACSLVTVVIHLLGDVPTPPLFGLALEASAAGRAAPTPGNWRAVLGGFTALMAVAAATWAVGGAAMTGGGGGEGAEGDAEGDAAAEGSETAASASDASSGREDGDAAGVASRRRRGDRGLDAATVPFLAGGAEGSAAEEARGEDGRARETETRRARARARGALMKM